MLLPDARPALMGILNVTPDSFSDGGSYDSPEEAVEAALRMVDDGADLIDVGGESTRPGAEPVSVDEELRRVLPIVRALAWRGIPVSVDTMKSDVARPALAEGAQIVNDVSAFRDPEMAAVCADAGCIVCLMHMLGEPRTMQQAPSYPRGVVPEVVEFLANAAAMAQKRGIRRDLVWLDPGIGFGKTLEHNLELLARLPSLVSLGYPVLIGVSRKSFIGRIAGSKEPLPVGERLEGTLAVQVLAQAGGAKIVRAHDVRAARRAIEAAAAVLGAGNR